jgi:hypothetical protein
VITWTLRDGRWRLVQEPLGSTVARATC